MEDFSDEEKRDLYKSGKSGEPKPDKKALKKSDNKNQEKNKEQANKGKEK